MKRFVDFQGQNLTGGAGFTNDDFFQSQEQIYQVLQGLSKSLIEKIGLGVSAVISGCEITGSDPYNISAGIVFIANDIYYMPSQTGITGGTKYIVPDSDVYEQRIYGDGGTKNFFVTKTATISSTTQAGAIEFDPSNNELFFVGERPSVPWNNIPLDNGWGGVLEYRVSIDGDIHLRSRNLSKGTSNTLVNVFPSNILPASNLHYIPSRYVETTDGVSAGFVYIDNNLGPDPFLAWIGTQGHLFSNVVTINDFYAIYRPL